MLSLEARSVARCGHANCLLKRERSEYSACYHIIVTDSLPGGLWLTEKFFGRIDVINQKQIERRSNDPLNDVQSASIIKHTGRVSMTERREEKRGEEKRRETGQASAITKSA